MSNPSFFLSLSLSLLRGPKEMKDPRWVEGFHSGTYSNKNICLFSVLAQKKQRSQSYQLPSIMLSVVLCNIGQYTLKHEHLTTLSRALPHSKKKKWSRLLQTVISWSANHLLYHIVLPVVTWTLRTSNAPAPPTDTWKRSTQTWKQFHASAINLNSLFSRGQLLFLLFCCTVIFHQDVNLTF